MSLGMRQQIPIDSVMFYHLKKTFLILSGHWDGSVVSESAQLHI